MCSNLVESHDDQNDNATMKNVIAVLIASVFALTACQTLTPEQRAEYNAKRAANKAENQKAAAERARNVAYQRRVFEASRPICRNDADCKVKWDASQLWLAKNSPMKIQIATDVVLETYGSTRGKLAFRVTKEPIGAGEYRIFAEAGCDNPFGCSPMSPKDAVKRFNASVSAVGE